MHIFICYLAHGVQQLVRNGS